MFITLQDIFDFIVRGIIFYGILHSFGWRNLSSEEWNTIKIIRKYK